MSEWYEVELDDIELDPNSDEVDILISGNNFGNVYLALTFAQIEYINKLIKNKP